MNTIIDYYERYNEDIRLIKDNAHRVEFITTMTFLSKYIRHEDRVLDFGCGTGIYSIELAKRVKQVYALDLSTKHIDRLKSRIKEQNILNIIPDTCSGLELSAIQDNSIDVLLCMGPMYHLQDSGDRETCLSECIRVTKNNGIVAIAYLNRIGVIYSLQKSSPDYFKSDAHARILKTGMSGNDCFYHFSQDEMKDMCNNHRIIILENIASDGLSQTNREYTNALDDEAFKNYLAFHLETCTDKTAIGASIHGLVIGKVQK